MDRNDLERLSIWYILLSRCIVNNTTTTNQSIGLSSSSPNISASTFMYLYNGDEIEFNTNNIEDVLDKISHVDIDETIEHFYRILYDAIPTSSDENINTNTITTSDSINTNNTDTDNINKIKFIKFFKWFRNTFDLSELKRCQDIMHDITKYLNLYTEKHNDGESDIGSYISYDLTCNNIHDNKGLYIYIIIMIIVYIICSNI